MAQEALLCSQSVSHLVLAWDSRATHFILICYGAQGPAGSPAQDGIFLSLELLFAQTSFTPPAPPPAPVAVALLPAVAQPSLHLALLPGGGQP